jgi:hypothetical protein
MVSFTPRSLYPRGKSPWYPLARRLGLPQSRSGRHGEVKILDPIGIRTPTPRSSTRSQSLYRLSYPGSCCFFTGLHKSTNIIRLCLSHVFMLVSCLVYSSTLKVKATSSSETSVDFQRTTRRFIQ